MGRDDILREPPADATRLRRVVPVDALPPASRWIPQEGLSASGVTRARGATAAVRSIVTTRRRLDKVPVALRDQSAGPPGTGTPPADADWGEWLGVWKARLIQTAGNVTASAASTESGRHEGVERLCAAVQAFVAALDGGHAVLIRELSQSGRLEADVVEARAALAVALVDLAGTRAGERHARHLALHDALTALPNRRYFREKLTAALAQRPHDQPPVAVLYLDLDGFKPINDAHGHDVGDKLLQIVAARLSRTVRAGDMVSRIGGDEFACLIAGTLDRHRLTQLADKLYEAVSAPLRIGRLELVVRPSIGIAVCPSDGDTAERLIESADAAMYRAKRTGAGHAFMQGDVSH